MSDTASRVRGGGHGRRGEDMAEHGDDESTALAGCPPWCVRRHAPHDHAEDRLHQSAPGHAVLVTGRPWLEPRAAPRATALVTRLVRMPGSRLTWLEVAEEEGGSIRLSMTVESGRELVDALDSVLAQAGA